MRRCSAARRPTYTTAPAVHLLGANGFPSAAYVPLLRHLPAGTTRGDYHPHFGALGGGGAHDWAAAVRAVNDDVVGVGHSGGGALLRCAAAARPELYRGVVM
eukprot:gene23162-24119_t